MEGEFLEGLKHGLWQTFNRIGQPLMIGYYDRGRKNGKFEQWYDDGKKRHRELIATFVNDQYDGLGLQNFKIKLKKLIKKALFYSGYNSNNVFVLSIPDWGVTPFAKDRNPNEIMKEINQFNSVIMEVCENEGLK